MFIFYSNSRESVYACFHVEYSKRLKKIYRNTYYFEPFSWYSWQNFYFFQIRDFPFSRSKKLPKISSIFYFLLRTHTHTHTHTHAKLSEKIIFLTNLYANVRKKWRVKSVIFSDLLRVFVTRSKK